jgi:hypothetical protein
MKLYLNNLSFHFEQSCMNISKAYKLLVGILILYSLISLCIYIHIYMLFQIMYKHNCLFILV